MRTLALAFAGGVAICLAAPSHARAEVKRAIVIGIDRYAASGRWQNLDGAVADARDIAELLRKSFRFDVVVELVDEQASADAIRKKVRETLIDPAGKGDIGVLYYAGHGSWIRNSLAPNPERRDQTIVPADGKDIRSVEVGRWLVEAAQKGARLTAVFDSCHSAGVTRGIADGAMRARSALPDEVDHPDASPRPNPAGAGVLMLYAARPEQLAQESTVDGRAHGAFTAALLQALGTAPADASAQQVFASAHARVKSAGGGQDPVIEGNPERRDAPLFSPPVRGANGRPVVAAGNVRGAEVELFGGSAIGIAPRTTLVRPAAGKKPFIRLTVAEVTGPTRSQARVEGAEDGAVESVEPGDAFEVERWANLAPEPLRVQLGDLAPAAEVAHFVKALAPLRSSRKVHWVDDPASLDPTHVLLYRSGKWALRGADGREDVFASLPTPARIEELGASARRPARAAPCADRACVFVRLPAPAELAGALGWGRGAADPVVAAPLGAKVDYVLAGRIGERGPEYALIAAGGAASQGFPAGKDGLCADEVPLPARTDFVVAGGGTDAVRSAAAELNAFALKLARIHAWLAISPPDDGLFPYHLELRSDGKPLGGSTVGPGASIEMRLVPDPVRLARGGVVRFPYVFAIDCKGRIDVAYPEYGREPARFPPRGPDAKPGDPQVLGSVTLDETRGPYTFVLVSSSEQIANVSLIEQGGVRRGGDVAVHDDLGAFLGTLGSTRGVARSTRVDWSVERVGFVVSGK